MTHNINVMTVIYIRPVPCETRLKLHLTVTRYTRDRTIEQLISNDDHISVTSKISIPIVQMLLKFDIPIRIPCSATKILAPKPFSLTIERICSAIISRMGLEPSVISSLQ